MTQYQYNLFDGITLEQMNKLGAEGWEFFSVDIFSKETVHGWAKRVVKPMHLTAKASDPEVDSLRVIGPGNKFEVVSSTGADKVAPEVSSGAMSLEEKLAWSDVANFVQSHLRLALEPYIGQTVEPEGVRKKVEEVVRAQAEMLYPGWDVNVIYDEAKQRFNVQVTPPPEIKVTFELERSGDA